MIIEEQYITKNKVYTIAGFGSTVMWTFGFVLALRQGWGDFWNAILPICLICIPIIIFSILMLMMSLLWYVKIDGDTVTTRNMFGITKKYYLDDLWMKAKDPKKKGTLKVYIYLGDKKVATITVFDKNFYLISKFKSRP